MRRDVFQAIADPTRREIIQLLATERLTLNGLAQQFAVSRPAISKHIRILSECGLVVIEPAGRHRYCQLVGGPLKAVSDWAGQYETFWEQKVNDLEAYLSPGGAP